MFLQRRRLGCTVVLVGLMLTAASGESQSPPTVQPPSGSQAPEGLPGGFEPSPAAQTESSPYMPLTAGTVAIMPAPSRVLNVQKLNRKMMFTGIQGSSPYCFKPGVGWIRLSPVPTGTETPTYQTIPSWMAGAELATRRLPRSGDGDDCAADGSLTVSPPVAGYQDLQPSTPGQQPAGVANGSSASADDLSANASVSGAVSGEAATEFGIDPETGEPAYSFGSDGTADSLVSLRTSVTSDGEFSISIPAPEHPIIQTSQADYLLRNPWGLPSDLLLVQNTLENHSLAAPIATFIPGQAVAPPAPMTGFAMEQGTAGQSPFDTDRSLKETVERSYLGSSDAEEISAKARQEYWKLRRACRKLNEQEQNQADDTPSAEETGILSATQEEDLIRMRRTCSEITTMSREAFLRKMMQHGSSH